ncbi:spermidine/putrescine ABC transporter ATP-binding protein [Aeromicrobium sp. PE09-221]|uniref:ABC transporter ATP-binding protein n=1 Tax=Aeromicrobium sp. PE09-221 TaxID=1898043 RepID=UPI000B3E679B|nr:ABC transporter ATP-binding protein [Aeromicrobium sp. PE09-221]OUZ12700.1 spermidine/putrescine ABC transporter ATP-binding protein [Aeromicrobium sp. PE09-221]
MTNPPNEVVLDHVSKSFGTTTVLRELDLHLRAGELVAVLGPSGCGKTTALRILAGFERPTSGRVLVDGRDITDLPANKRDIGMVFQAYSLFPHLSVAANVEYGLRIRGTGAAERSRRGQELLEMCGLGALSSRYPHELSGGQQQRVALARALAVQPKVLLLDEPLSALDAIVRRQIRDEIRRLQQQLGITTMFVTHDQEEAMSIADRVAVVNHGSIEQIAAPREIYHRPRTQFVASFVGTISEIGVSPSCGSGRLEVHHPGPGRDTLYVRPEDLRLQPEATGTHVVVAHTFIGERTLVRASGDEDRPDIVSSVSTAEAGSVLVGTRVTPYLAAEPALRIASTSSTPDVMAV